MCLSDYPIVMKTIRSGELNQHQQRITHLQAEANYTFVYFVDQPRQLLSRTLSVCQDSLPGFIRIHRKYLINADFASTHPIQLGSAQLVVHTHCLPISRRLLKAVRQALAHSGSASFQPRRAQRSNSLGVQTTQDIYRDISLTWK